MSIDENLDAHLRAIACAISVHRWNLWAAFKTWRMWQDGSCQLYDWKGEIA